MDNHRVYSSSDWSVVEASGFVGIDRQRLAGGFEALDAFPLKRS
jgi:hypothetical protein